MWKFDGSMVALGSSNATAVIDQRPNPAFKRTDTGGAHLRVFFTLRAPVPAA